MDKHVEVLLEQILENLEVIKRNQISNNNSVQSKIINDVNQRLENIESYHPVLNSNLVKVGNAFIQLRKKINAFEPVNRTKVEHVFFPGIQSWIDSLKRWKFVLIFKLIAVFSIANCFYLFEENSKLEEGYYKHKASLYFNESPTLLDSVYSQYEKEIKHKVDSIEESLNSINNSEFPN